MADGEAEALLQSMRERRLMTLGLADQVAQERWREPLLPGGETAHAMLSHLLAWDEWATAVFELSALRELPEKLKQPLREADAFNARAVARYSGLDRDVLLTGLQGASVRLLSAATSIGLAQWPKRRIADLILYDASASDQPSREPGAIMLLKAAGADGQSSGGPSVAGLLEMLREHERQHGEEFAVAFGVTVDLEALRAQALGEQQNQNQNQDQSVQS